MAGLMTTRVSGSRSMSNGGRLGRSRLDGAGMSDNEDLAGMLARLAESGRAIGLTALTPRVVGARPCRADHCR